jgi:hypothetical protein
VANSKSIQQTEGCLAPMTAGSCGTTTVDRQVNGANTPTIIQARWPGIMSRATAAAYCDLTVHGFDEWVRKGRLPQPIPGTKRWSRSQIERFIDLLVGGSVDDSQCPSLEGVDLTEWLRANGYEDQA